MSKPDDDLHEQLAALEAECAQLRRSLQRVESKHRRLQHSAQAQRDISERNKQMMFRTHELLTREIEERTRTETALRDAMREVEGAAAAKAAFLANMSHELRTPMNGVLGMLDLALRAPMDSELRSFLDTAHSSAGDLLVLLDDILDLSKIDAGRLELEQIDFAPWDAMDDVVAVFAAEALQKGLHVEIDVAPTVPGRVLGDPVRFRQILKNLLSNAVKFTEEGGVIATIRYDEPREQLTVEVTDTGCGIAPDRLGEIFDAFTQADSSTTRRFGGTGLGLTIARRLARAMGGNLTVTSVVGEGSCFALTCRTPIGDEDSFTTATGRVAVDVQDELDRRMLTRILSSLGAEVDFEDPDVVVSDHKTADPDALDVPRICIVDGLSAPVSAGSLRCPRPLRRKVLAELLEKAVAQPEEPTQANEDPRPLGLRVLVAEDHPVNQILTQRMVERLGCAVELVEDGTQAIDAVQAAEYDVILMDCQMPNVDGYQATRTIRTLGVVQPWIIALTANALSGDRERCIDAGMDDYVAKPVSLDALADALGRVDPDTAGVPSSAVKAS